ncbi:hypothetical protein [Pontibacter sp. BAB1700]|uniref:hypothetical protein n=1 Tax=Pontibacter sp. BAB1700 TaxID=1144253 RepID=UPI00026BBDED|nr:hypothetical protein [Pontibacter sp. BAB1700]EJF08109.1 hypothetical protein O71_22746 [Pontibacter sp. BAB1700]
MKISKCKSFIFKKNHDLILSRNGQVQMGKWEYLREARSLIIDRGNDKILCNEAFIDKGVMILRLDGTDNQFFVLTNENVVQDLDANRYLKELRYQNLKLIESKLSDGRILEVKRQDTYYQYPRVGDSVSIEAEEIEDGKYKMKDKKIYKTKDSRIIKILTETTYSNPDGVEIVIEQKYPDYITVGDNVFIYGQKAKDGLLNYSKSKFMVIQNGKFIDFERKNPLLKSISRSLANLFGG